MFVDDVLARLVGMLSFSVASGAADREPISVSVACRGILGEPPSGLNSVNLCFGLDVPSPNEGPPGDTGDNGGCFGSRRARLQGCNS